MAIYDPKQTEKEILEFWEKHQVPQKIVKFDKKRPKFYLLDGPPYVNNIPHVGHIKTTTFKDVWSKFKFMQGFSVWFQPGFDCSGLPIENAVEKLLGIKTKKDIEKIGVSRFIQECRRLAEKNLGVWLQLYRKLGAWRGWAQPYLTYKNYYIESGWWTLKKLYEKGLLVEGERPGYWCPRCQTVLAGYEVSDSYQNLKDPSIFVKFRVRGKDEFLLVWTTTPWTLPANVAIAVHPDEKYVRVELENQKLILAKKRLDVLKDLGFSFKVLDEFPGKHLEGLKYEPVLSVPLQEELKKNEKAHQVLVSIPIIKRRVASKVGGKEKEEFGHLVDMETGTGLVHIAPGHGDSDNRLGRHYGLPDPSPVDEEGKLTEEAGRFAGIPVKEADPKIIQELEKNGFLLYSGWIVHSYPLCWRCKTPLIYRKSKQWFLKLDTLRDGMLKEAEEVRWLPGFARDRFINTLMEAPDWAITRQRYWGIPLPIWECQKCGRKLAIGSKSELKRLSIEKLPEDLDLHKDTVDRIRLKCECGGEMRRFPDIMDVWFDSGIAPWASLGYPFRNRELFHELWPVDLIDESQDQIRGWFYTLMLSGFAVWGQKPYLTVCLNGWTLDEKGEKMSKSVGNVIWAEDAWEKLGADLLRLYYCWDTPPWQTQKFSFRIAEELRGFLNILWNACEFAKLYAKPSEVRPEKLEDRWILSRLNTLVEELTQALEEFRFHHASRQLISFIIEDLSRTYIKLIRPRIIQQGDPAASFCLLRSLETCLKLLAPFAPFISEKLWLSCFNQQSVHLQPWPKPDPGLIDKKLEDDFKLGLELVEAINAARHEEGIKLRWPLKAVYFEPKDSEIEEAILRVKDIVKFLANFQTLKIYKPKGVPEERPKSWHPCDLGKIGLGEPDLQEAFFRELTRRIQDLRKKAGLRFQQKINLRLDPK
ncbi:MAG: isoleucine--tRNA ligase, partial [Candidatus Aenigmatarchaeota archaeon]